MTNIPERLLVPSAAVAFPAFPTEGRRTVRTTVVPASFAKGAAEPTILIRRVEVSDGYEYDVLVTQLPTKNAQQVLENVFHQIAEAYLASVEV